MLTLLSIKAFLRTHWTWIRWVLLTVTVILAVLICTQLYDYFAASSSQRKLRRQVKQDLNAYQEHLRSDQRARSTSDSTFHTLQGQKAQLDQTIRQQKTDYEALPTLLHAPVLPAVPPRPRSSSSAVDTRGRH
jgi:septal ring factor EnvC (AmiA/AmiB activator)